MITPVLRVRDIDLSMAFYTRVLGFEAEGGLPGLDGRTVYAEAYLGDSRIMFSRRCGGAPLINGVELYVTLPTHLDIEQFYSHLKNREVAIVEDMRQELWGDCAFTIIDLDGNRLTFAQAVQYPVCIEALAFEQIA